MKCDTYVNRQSNRSIDGKLLMYIYVSDYPITHKRLINYYNDYQFTLSNLNKKFQNKNLVL